MAVVKGAKTRQKIVLIDGQNLAYRSFYRFRDLSYEGQPTGVLHGLLTLSASLARRHGPARWIWVWDAGRKATWRHEFDPEYKKGRVAGKSQLVDLWPQLATWKRWLTWIRVSQVEVEGVEGDDLIGLLAAKLCPTCDVMIYSTDRDFFQLLSLPHVEILREPRGTRSAERITRAVVQRDFRISPEQWPAWRALIGDDTDDIPRPKRGVGPRTAALLLGLGLNPEAPWCAQKKEIQVRCATWQPCWDRVRRNVQLTRIPRSFSDAPFGADRLAGIRVALDEVEGREGLAPQSQSDWDRWTMEMVRLGLSETMAVRGVLWKTMARSPAGGVRGFEPD